MPHRKEATHPARCDQVDCEGLDGALDHRHAIDGLGVVNGEDATVKVAMYEEDDYPGPQDPFSDGSTSTPGRPGSWHKRSRERPTSTTR